MGSRRFQRVPARRTRVDERGLTIIEVLISIAIIAGLLGAVTTAVITMGRASAEANSATRANVLVTSYGELLKQLSYRECSNGDLAELYTEAVELYESQLPVSERLIPAGSVDQTVGITSVDAVGGCVSGSDDRGEQIIDITATVRGVERTGQIVKRNTGPIADGPVARPDAVRVSESGNPQGIFTLSASRSTPIAEIIEFEWDCGDSPPTVLSFDSAESPDAICYYQASTTAATDYTVRLTVTDLYGNTSEGTVTVTVPRASAARPAPVAVINATPTTGTADLVVSFTSTGSNSLAGTIVSYAWDFGDPLSGAENESSLANPPTHTYRRAGTFTVSLTVTDEIGLTGTAQRQITVSRPGTPPPVAAFTFSPSPAVAPQVVSFDGTASRTASNQAVSSYEWEFGEDGDGDGYNDSAPGATTTHRYKDAGTYTVRLTVTDSLGVTGTTTRSIVVGALDRPSNFRLTDAKAELASDGHFYFAWTNTSVSAGDSLSYEIEIRAVAGCIAFGTKTRTVGAGAAGSVQTYDFSVGWPASNVCLGSQYDWRVRAKRVSSSEGTLYSSWSLYQRFFVTHT